MKANKKSLCLLLCACVAVLLLAGCGETDPPNGGQTSPPTSTDTPAVSPTDTPEPPAQGQTATLYIGTKAEGFSEYPLGYEGELTPEVLIQGIVDLTGWNLTLDGEITSGKGGIGVCLSRESALFVGPPNPQKEEFHMFGAEQLAETLLDSIQKTLQEGFTGEGGDPDVLDIWYYTEGNQPLKLPDIGRSWPIDQPYQWAAGQNEN